MAAKSCSAVCTRASARAWPVATLGSKANLKWAVLPAGVAGAGVAGATRGAAAVLAVPGSVRTLGLVPEFKGLAMDKYPPSGSWASGRRVALRPGQDPVDNQLRRMHNHHQ